MAEKKKTEKIFKTFRTIVIKAGDEEGVIDMLIPMSTGSVDRHGEAIDPKGWKKTLKEFKKRAIMLSSHGYQVLQNQIGEFLDLQVVEKGLLARPKYYINKGNAEADWGYFLATKGMAAYSVGFIPIKWEDSDGKDGKATRTFKEQELIEISHVTVPSNRDAIQEYKQLDEYKKEDPVVKEVIEEILENKEASNFYDSQLIMPYGKDRKELLKLTEEVITEIEETDEIIRIPAKGEEGKHKGHKIRWMNIDTKKGIRGIYCVDCKKIITYIFNKDKGWTVEKAKKWMKDNEKIVTNYYRNVDWDTKVKIEEIDWEEVKISIKEDDKDDKLGKMIDELKFYPEIIYRVLEDYEDIDEIKDLNTDLDLLEKIYQVIKENKELKKKLEDIELEAGAVLNAKNKGNLKKAQVLIQEVLDSAGEEEDLGNEGEEGKDNKKDDSIITITDTKKEDPQKDEKKEERTIKIDEKLIAEQITKTLKYTLGITDK